MVKQATVGLGAHSVTAQNFKVTQGIAQLWGTIKLSHINKYIAKK
jgi:hypothetical protein